jgi:hypothetical protein
MREAVPLPRLLERGREDRAAETAGRDGVVMGAHKLTARDVWKIRQRYSAGGVTYFDLAAEYGVTFQTIGHIITRRNWKHI